MSLKGVVTAVMSAVAVVIFAGTSVAQRDLAAELVGTWEGTQQQIGVRRGAETPVRERVLIIRSVKPGKGGWTVDATYGLPGEKPARFRSSAAQLTETADGVTLTLTYRSGNYVRLRLTDKDWLQGDYQAAEGGARPRTVSLKRVGPVPKS
jgi:hypothetical protein